MKPWIRTYISKETVGFSNLPCFFSAICLKDTNIASHKRHGVSNTGNSTVCSLVCPCVHQIKHKSSALLSIARLLNEIYQPCCLLTRRHILHTVHHQCECRSCQSFSQWLTKTRRTDNNLVVSVLADNIPGNLVILCFGSVKCPVDWQFFALAGHSDW